MAYRAASADAYKTVFLANFSLGELGMVICWLVAQSDQSKANFVAAKTHHVEEEKSEAQEGWEDVVGDVVVYAMFIVSNSYSIS